MFAEKQLSGSESLESKTRRRKVRNLRRLPLLRNAVQVSFALFLLYTGWRFQQFVAHFESDGASPFVPRPASVEAFLPISALVAFRSWIGTGVFDRVHPAGLAIFLTLVGISFLFKKGFCGWICPIGALSEALARAGRWGLGSNLRMPALLDWPLRGIKYLLLTFFVGTIFLGMSAHEAALFLEGAYNQVADVKMLQFFSPPGPEVVAFLIAMALLSTIFPFFWCRYLCPYGALLGLLSLMSPLKITRYRDSCTSCSLCTKACPHRIEVAKAGRVWSPECSGCLECVAACPRPGALSVASPVRTARLSPWAFPALLVGTLLLAAGAAQLTGHWQTSISYQDYARLIPIAGGLSH